MVAVKMSKGGSFWNIVLDDENCYQTTSAWMPRNATINQAIGPIVCV